jgi:hypothetical protein
MNQPEPVSEAFKDLIDDYLHGLLDEARLQELEDRLRGDAAARRYFVRYARLHTDLHLEVRARQAGARALDKIEQLVRGSVEAWERESANAPALALAPAPTRSRSHSLPLPRLLATAACLLLVVGGGWWLMNGQPARTNLVRESAIAWLVNAQNCEWAEEEPTGDMQAGKRLQLARGLAEIRFQCGARVMLEGPASLELLSGKSARLRHGKLTARVASVTGFEILSPQGKIIDLGTEFGVAVASDGATEVYVFEGKVEAQPTGAGAAAASPVSVTENQAARIAAGKVTFRPVNPEAEADRFVRAIVPPPVVVPRTFRLTFDRLPEGGIRDAGGATTGLTHRLPGTGRRLAEQDPNLRLDTAKGQLELTTTNSDLNTQFRLGQGEYLGVRLADLGFTGAEDFAVTVTILNIPALEYVGQFGLYAGPQSDQNIRGGLLSVRREEPGQYLQFLVHNKDGRDTPFYWIFNRESRFMIPPGTDLRLTLKRTAGKYALTLEFPTDSSATSLTIRHPEYQDTERDLFVGLFGANTQSAVRKTLVIKEFAVTVWTIAPPGETSPAE